MYAVQLFIMTIDIISSKASQNMQDCHVITYAKHSQLNKYFVLGVLTFLENFHSPIAADITFQSLASIAMYTEQSIRYIYNQVEMY